MHDLEIPGTVVCTLVFCKRSRTQAFYLAEGKKGVSKGFLNGFGGKVEPHQTPKQNAAEETFDESGVRIKEEHLLYSGTITFYSPIAKPKNGGNTQLEHIEGLGVPDAWRIVCHMFVALQWEGEFVETDAFKIPKEFPASQPPLERMIDGTGLWLVPMLEGAIVNGEIHYDHDKRVVAHRIEVVA